MVCGACVRCVGHAQLLERATILQGMSDEERRDWLVCFMWIVKNCDHLKLLRQWWKKDTLKNVKAFFVIVGLAIQTFQARIPRIPLSILLYVVCVSWTRLTARRLSQEPHLKRELGFTVLDVADEFMLDFHFELKDQTKEHMARHHLPPTFRTLLALCIM